MKVSGLRFRRGSGILLSGVILTLAILSVSAISRSYFTTSMASECQATMVGELCETLAGSAVAEMEAQVRVALAKKDSEVSVQLSRAVIGNQDSSIDLTPYVDLKETETLVGQDSFAECAVDDFLCRVAVQKCLDKLPYERIGVIQFKARVRAKGGGRDLARTVEEARAFKIVLVAPPRPFDRYGIFLGELGNVTSLAAVNPARTRLLDQLGRLRTKLDAGVTAQSGEPKERILDILDDLPAPAGAAEGAKEMGESRAGSMFYGLIPNFTEINMGKLELARSVTDAAESAETQLGALPAESDPAFPAKAKEAGKIIADALWSIWAFQAAFVVLSPRSAEYAQYKPFLSKLDEVWYARRAHYRLIEAPDAPNINVQLKELLASGPVYGIIHVQSKTQTLELSGNYPGRVMFAVGPGGVKVSDINKNETLADRLTIGAFGGPITVTGECHAHILTGSGAPLVLDRDAKIIGGLTVRELVPGTQLEGTVMRLEKYFSGIAKQTGEEDDATVFTLVLSPQILYRKVDRS